MRSIDILSGFLASIAFIAVTSALFLNSEAAYEWQPDLNRYGIKPGTQVAWRSEGWAQTRYGVYDVPAIPDIRRVNGSKAAIWGDSYVEALQVDDSRKMGQVLTELAGQRGMKSFTAFQVGHSGESAADYYFSILKYERFIDSIMVHFIVITEVDDILPQRQSPPHSLLRAVPAAGMTEGVPYAPAPATLAARNWLHEQGLDFMITLYRSAKNVTVFFPGGRPADGAAPRNGSAFCDDPAPAWRYLLGSMKKQANAKIVFIYCPPVPGLTGGMSLEPRTRRIMSAFAEECARQGFDFLDMTENFSDYYRRSGRFPRGFSNSRPAIGHLNEAGHLLVAERMLDYLFADGNLSRVADAN